MSDPLRWSLFSGPLPTVLLIVGAAAGAFLLIRSNRRWRTRVLPIIAVGVVLLTIVLAWFVNDVWRPFPDSLPCSVMIWVGVILAAVALGIAHFFSARWWRKTVAVAAAIAVLAAGMNEINRTFGYLPTTAAALGLPLPQQRKLPPIQRFSPQPGAGRQSPTVERWTAPVGMPAGGAVSTVTIPGVHSGFSARSAWIYLPPAYLTAHRPALPVLMLIPGQPGSPRNWIDAGRVIETMDAFAASHAGIAPVVVMPDPLGSPLNNSLCADTTLGKADTYLSTDVPSWVTKHLQVDPNTSHWAVGGFSFGGTCSLQLAVNHPCLFPTFLDISGQSAPTLGSRQRTLDRAFSGNARAFAKINPLDILTRAAHRQGGSASFAQVAGTLVVGTQDGMFAAEQRTIQAAAIRAGLAIRWLEVPGGHSWHVGSAALERSLPWLATRMALTR